MFRCVEAFFVDGLADRQRPVALVEITPPECEQLSPAKTGERGEAHHCSGERRQLGHQTRPRPVRPVATRVKWNGAQVGDTYAEMMRLIGADWSERDAARAVADQLREFAAKGDLPVSLRDVDASTEDLPALAAVDATE